MSNSLVRSKGIFSIFLTLVVIFMIVATSWGVFYLIQRNDPYIQTVLSLTGNVQRGHEIFEINCSACHGVQADGSVGPGLHEISKRKSKISLIHQVTSGKTPPMPKFQPKEQDMADLLSYLERL